MNRILHKFRRMSLYARRKVLLKYLLLKIIKGYKILSKKHELITIETKFDKIIYEFPADNNEYLFIANPLNELLVSSFINMKKGTFIDVGAFIGKHSIRLAKKTNVRVIAVEPNPISINILKRNIFLNNVQKKVEIIEAALVKDDNIQETQMIFDFDRSRILNNDEPLHSPHKVRTISFNKLISTYKVDFSNFVLMKIDIEGYEFELLKSMSEFLSNASNKFSMICEILHYNPQRTATINFLESLNFKLLQIDNENYFITKDKRN